MPFEMYGGQSGIKEFKYYISDDTSSWFNSHDTGYIYIDILNNNFDSLNINNINARFNSYGNHFWDMEGGSDFFVPNGSLQTSICTSTMWIGGIDDESDLHLSAERYRHNGFDYWSGPVSNVYDSIYDLNWNYMWKLDKAEIQYHRDHYSDPGYKPIHDILTWPGNGDTTLGQAFQLAPFIDWNNNGLYEPMTGEFPAIKGDQALFFIFNDKRDSHTESGGLPLGIEIHGMAYAYDLPGGSVLWNTIFLHYDIINRSDTTYSDTWLSIWTDFDLGYFYDDYLGCDIQRGGYFVYNGTPIDGSGEPWAYGEYPPAIGLLFLGGPYMEADNLDNPKYDGEGLQLCNESINGLNFGDSIIDNERLGMTKFLYHNSTGGIQGVPEVAEEYYNYLRGIWKDGVTAQYGGNAHPNSGAFGPDCSFMFPGDSDTCNWGTNGVPPNGGLNTPGNYWTEESAGNNPADRRGMGSSGPFTFEPGAVQKLDVAFVFARDFNGTPWSSVELLKERFDYLIDLFQNDQNFFSGVGNKPKLDNKLSIYPNPVTNTLHFKLEVDKDNFTYRVYSTKGLIVKEGVLDNRKSHQINLDFLKEGLYVLQVTGEGEVYLNKFIKR
jgi:hypothetical protein